MRWAFPGPRRSDTQLHLLFRNKEELIKEIIINSSLGYSDHEIGKTKILRR